MNVVIFNTAIGTSNNGDYIIYESAKEAINNLLDNSFVMEFGSHLNNLGALHYVLPSPKCKFANICDYKFVMGTNLLTSNMFRSIRQWPVYSWNKKLYSNSIMMGVGTTYEDIHMDIFTKKMYCEILRKDIIHSVRDEKSKEMLESISGIKALNTGCPTLWKLTEEVCAKIPSGKGKNVIVSVSGYKSQLDCDADQKMIDIIEENYDTVYLWAQTTEDEKYFRTLKHSKDYKILYSVKQFQKCCENGDVDYIGTRLHGGIYAMQNGVRSIIIEIDHRARGFRIDNNINTVDRKAISNLAEMINHDIKTDIHLNRNSITEWLSQFK